ncbi:MAG: DoxX family protein [Candidatus Magasanikbacteria bacterium]|nr:DoxX family protein [Candidatus Magasanikbacteria bacterium]
MFAFFAMLHGFSDWGLLALRFAIGAIFLAHGTSKWKMWKMQPSAQMPAAMLGIMRLLSIAEPLGALAVIFGFLIQPATLGLCLVMVGAIKMKTMDWKKTFAGDGGWEFDLIIFAACFALYFLGAGHIALDSMLFGL